MTDLHFYASAVIEGTIYGLGVDSTPDQWTAELSDQCLDDARKRRMRRDYGLIEVSFHRPKGEREWRCYAISVQIHRLAWGIDNNIPERLNQEHGPFNEHMPFDAIYAEIQARGAQLEKNEGEPSPGFESYRLPSARSAVYVMRTQGSEDDPHQEGDVWSLGLVN
ncbi:hypothetical protein [Streptomyces litchfieldiae]|uniref:Uncharacterized protein n=1 Tax=Streptomyces litchfieldiae TaxID=3075543 RepID=A0ABU2N4E0_9ACTN|nr:hypothetical protein [Streptomyces sp. DSM 44938]MDT0347604.1 hypothetical protein [Streptomyces sp. DSM 44938]